MKSSLRQHLLLLFFALSFAVSIAQKIEYPSYRIGITPTALLNYYPGLQLSFDKGLARNNFELEAAYIFNSPYNARGFRIRPGIERLWARGQKSSLSVGLHLNYRWSLEFRDVLRVANNGEFQRFFYNQKRSRHYIGPLISLKFLSNISNKVVFETGIGVGPGNYTIVDEFQLENNDSFGDRGDFPFLDESIAFFGLANFHVNFSYIIKE